jgi:hypothetical protein
MLLAIYGIKQTESEKREAIEISSIDDDSILRNKDKFTRLVDVRYEDFHKTISGIDIKISFWGNFFIDIDRFGFWATLKEYTSFNLSGRDLFPAYETVISLVADLIESFGYSVCISDQEINIKPTPERLLSM